MRRLLAIALAVLAAGLLVALPAIGADEGPYRVRAIFDNGGFVVADEEVRVAGATVGKVESVDVSREGEIVSREGGGRAIPGKAVVVMAIEDDAFKDFREDASCIIRPQSLIGEKFIDCTTTQQRAPGSQPPPELEEIPDGEPGEGQRLLPLENNGKAVDLDLVQNIYRAPYRDRFRLILNDLGAGVAARGQDLARVIERANPALRQTNRVLNILALQNRALADLAANGDRVLAPLARERQSLAGFIENANVSAQAAAERRADLEGGLQRLPRFLRELRLTMRDLRGLTDQGGPLFENLRIAAPHISRATQKLGPLAGAGIPAFRTLGDAAQTAGPKLVAANPLLADLAQFADGAPPVGKNLSALLDSFFRTKGFEYLFDFVFFTVGNINGFDSLGHFQRGNVQVTSCLNVNTVVVEGCDANFVVEQAQTPTKKKKKRRSRRSRRAGGVAPPIVAPPSPLPGPEPPPSQEDAPEPQIEELIPELQPEAPQPEAAPEQPQPQGSEQQAEPPSQPRTLATSQSASVPPQPGQMSLTQAESLLEFLLGGRQ